MSRHNQGPRLDFLRKRGRYYIVWTENGRSKQRSTSTADREAAEVELAKFLRQRNRRSGPRDPTEVLVTDVLIDYMNDRASKVRAASRIAYAVEPLARFFEGKTIQQAPSNCDAYIKWRREGPKRQIKSGTVRRELNVLRSAVNHAYRVQQLNRIVPFVLPPEGPPRDRWLTRSEAAMLLAGALGFAPTTCEVSTRRPIKWARVAKPLPHLALFILISLLTGRRKEAILSLRWPAVDFKRSIIDFRRPDEPETKKRRGS